MTDERERFYVTTAINYTNGSPHIGHAYEALTADVIARYHRVYGRNVFFLTGTDEHGQKIGQAAEAQGVSPLTLCDGYVAQFQALNKKLAISNDRFVRTTEEEHIKIAQLVWQKAFDHGDIYLGQYSGWYNVKEEAFVTDLEAQEVDFKDGAGNPLTKMEEESYFFRLSKYQEALKTLFKENPTFLQPDNRRAEILARLENIELKDVSVSRTTFDWGIPVPNDPKHVMYVWFDALTNYLTGIDYPSHERAAFWPANVHVIGKDILWFHSVIWPAMLMSAQIPLPERVFGHGFVNDDKGKKMSKSIGNVVDPIAMLDAYPLDSFRYFLIREAPYGNDLSFSEKNLVTKHNTELANNWGNLLNRAVNLAKKYCGAKVPDVKADRPFDIAKLTSECETEMASLKLDQVLLLVLKASSDTNAYLQSQAPWKKDVTEEQRRVVVRTVLEAAYVVAHFLLPFLPETCGKVFKQLSTEPTTLLALSAEWDNLAVDTPVSIAGVLFPKLVYTKVVHPIQKVSLRVGKVVEVGDHPNSEILFLLKVDVGEEKPRQVVAGLKAFYQAADLQDLCVVVVMNLKPSNIRKVRSEGMLLTTESKTPAGGEGEEEKVEVKLLQTNGAAVGSVVQAKGHSPDLDSKPLTIKVFQKLEFIVKEGRVYTKEDEKAPLVAVEVDGGKEVEIVAAGVDGSLVK
eukprot:TRINITY_DN1337_c0_g1_i1.p1 TRINITY_DN1337_c0_g1~~TRINITY_DN1337_c0_g1_i1.p1  ORF type:complete len:684 (+),score=205.61 TRINITY_DN1337_c0_g1_i1:142-2193(+)